MNRLAALLAVLAVPFLGCDLSKECTSRVTNLKISKQGDAALLNAEQSYCASYSPPSLQVSVKLGGGYLDLSEGDEGQWVNGDGKWAEGERTCEKHEVHAVLELNGVQWTAYGKGNPANNHSSCTMVVATAPHTGTLSGRFKGQLGRFVDGKDEVELVDVSFDFELDNFAVE